MATDVEWDEDAERMWHWMRTGHVALGTNQETASHLRQINYEMHLEDLAYNRTSDHLMSEHGITNWARQDRHRWHAELHAAGACGHVHEGDPLGEGA